MSPLPAAARGALPETACKRFRHIRPKSNN